MAKEKPKSKTTPKTKKTTAVKSSAAAKKTEPKAPVKPSVKAAAKPKSVAKVTQKVITKASAMPVKKAAVVAKVAQGKSKSTEKPKSTAARAVSVESSPASGVSSRLVSIKEAMQTANSLRMFKNPFLEKLSHVHPLTPIFLYLPVITLSVYYYFLGENATLFSFLIFYISGAFFWTIAEYAVHRFLFHPPYSDSHLRWLYFYTHGVHHEAPNDATRLVMPPGASIPLATIFYFIFQALLPDDHLAFYAGFVSGYLVYDFLHFSTHFFAFEWEWFKKLRKHHNVHHFNAPDKNYGVSNSLWDYVFSTKYRSNN